MFGLVGAVAGGVLLALGFWLYTLGHQVQEQTEALKTIGKSVEVVSKDRTGLTEAEVRAAAKEEALDALLAEVRVGGSSERVTRLVTEARQERALALRELKQRNAVFTQFSGEVAKLQDDREKLKADLEKAEKELKNTRMSKEDREKLKELEEKYAETSQKLAAARTRADDLEDAKSGKLIDKYYMTWYAAAAGWGLCLLLGVGLLANLAKGATGQPEGPREEPIDPGAHQIT